MRTKELEVQYHMARYEREKKGAETEGAKARQLQAQVQAFTKTETELRNQLNVYVDKFKQARTRPDPKVEAARHNPQPRLTGHFHAQVEDTLNNSNDLFLSFRKEMEDMSKKGKRLEKENEGLKRQKEATAANILRMAEERQEFKKRSEAAERKMEKLMSIIQGMQQQGRSVPPAMTGAVEGLTGSGANAEHGGADESEYSDEEDDEEEDDEELSEFDEDDEDTEEDPQPSEQSAPVRYGPERPPHQQQAQAKVNGH